jgi:hypothetical protein
MVDILQLIFAAYRMPMAPMEQDQKAMMLLFHATASQDDFLRGVAALPLATQDRHSALKRILMEGHREETQRTEHRSELAQLILSKKFRSGTQTLRRPPSIRCITTFYFSHHPSCFSAARSPAIVSVSNNGTFQARPWLYPMAICPLQKWPNLAIDKAKSMRQWSP